LISVRDLHHRYPGGARALEGVNVEFQRGGTSAVLGESGSGKTTLLMCLARFLTPRQGTITLDGTDIREIPERAFRGKVGVVFQKLHLFPHLTVLQNMTLAMVHVQGRERSQASS
jgi:polar amino acid transport system ATP-binding protein